MADGVRVMMEQGKKRAVASAFDWPGWDRNSKTEELVLEKLELYRPRYAKVAALAGLAQEFDASGALTVVERVDGGPSTDFHGVSVKTAAAELEQMSETECERKLALLWGCWKYFDDVAARVSEELRKGPRGGGKDRSRIMQHTIGHEMEDLAANVGVKTTWELWNVPAEVQAHRERFAEAIRDYSSRGEMARKWTVQFLIRRCAYHMLDHAWEMEDRDQSGEGA
ncbi:hypothetical protein AYO38_03960 [bacterium SCGC AG-212-C10]|nr:hypothetical protein AYO38_03960 [bacterium SCGC AG-212-C10]